ncbi:amino acid ABC transporter permease [Marinomonas sp.]|nr:amino acid ABC transporter permease [Marinomonas sp.]MDB4838160.1 amino acid ABC transporter permease [Marinomonas sp.]
MNDSLSILWEERALFINGTLNTILLVITAGILSLIGGVLLAITMKSGSKRVQYFTQLLVDIARSIPFLLLAYIFYYALPQFGLRLPAWWAGLIALTLYNTAYFGEIFRASWSNLPITHIETGRAFGMTQYTLLKKIVFPQVFLNSAPLIGSQFIVMIKDTAFLTIITVQDLTFAANFINANYFKPFAPFVLALAIYWVLCHIVEQGVSYITKLADKRRFT